ncbi:MAG: hypothetical protein IJA72_04400 [Clostridia bacterium]|nr:hypothetical protein [Clostridia bacterium]
MFLQLLANVAETWQEKVVGAVNKILIPLLVIACAVGMVWAIIVGIKMIKADDKTKRDENKQQLINIAISLVATAVLIGLFYGLMNWIQGYNGNTKQLKDDFNIFTCNVNPLKNTLSLVKQCASMVIFKC